MTKKKPPEKLLVDHDIADAQIAGLMRILWDQIIQNGGKIHLSGDRAGPVSGFMSVEYDSDGGITVEIKPDGEQERLN